MGEGICDSSRGYADGILEALPPPIVIQFLGFTIETCCVGHHDPI